MAPIEKCLQTLRVLVREGDVNGIILAEKAIDEFLQIHDGPSRRTGALHVLDRELIAIRQGLSSGPSVDFVETLFSYIDEKMKALRVPLSSH